MHGKSLDEWRRSHDFLADSSGAERSTLYVIVLTALMMVVEIGAGVLYGSMALLADGWHMGTHVAAFGITLYAYRYARAHAHDRRFSFGTGKVATLGGFASAVALAMVALLMAMESILRLFDPHLIRFDEAIGVAIAGLVVNLVSGVLLHRAPADIVDDAMVPVTGDRHHDHNLRAAYVHVLADALTSVLAIVALLGGKLFGWHALDPLIGVLGAVLIARWSLHLMRASGHVLLDATADARLCDAVVDAIEGDADNRIADLHLWQVGQGHYAAEIALVTHHPRPPAHYKDLLESVPGLAHVLVEVNPCADRPCAGPE